MDIKKYLEEKKGNVTKKAKQVALTGLAAATILGGVAGLTGCEQKDFSDINYLDMMSMLQEDFKKCYDNFEYDFIIVNEYDKEYYLHFFNDEAGDVVYSITKSQYTAIKNCVEILKDDESVESFGETGAVFGKELLESAEAQELRSIISEVVDQLDPIIDKEVSSVEDNNVNGGRPQFNIEQSDDISKMFESLISEFSQMSPDDPEMQDFVADEFVVKKTVDSLGLYRGNNGNINESEKIIVLQIIDYRDRDGDGEYDGYVAINSVCDDKVLANSLYNDLADFVDNENVTFEDSAYHISMNVFGDERYADLDKRLKDYFDLLQIFNLNSVSHRQILPNDDFQLVPVP